MGEELLGAGGLTEAVLPWDVFGERLKVGRASA